MPGFCQTPAPPYHVVLFTALRTPDDNGYGDRVVEMEALARQQPGFLGLEGVRGADGYGITVSYWESEAAIAAWSANLEHRQAKATGRRRWYERYILRVGRVDRECHWSLADRANAGEAPEAEGEALRGGKS